MGHGRERDGVVLYGRVSEGGCQGCPYRGMPMGALYHISVIHHDHTCSWRVSGWHHRDGGGLVVIMEGVI